MISAMTTINTIRDSRPSASPFPVIHPPRPAMTTPFPRRARALCSLGLALAAAVIALPQASRATYEFASSEVITINDGANADPYPSTITVSEVVGTIGAVRVKLNGLSHTWPNDLDIFLMAPDGKVSALVSDAGGRTDIVNVNLVFDDTAETVIPEVDQITSGSYRPANYAEAEALPPGGTNSVGANLTALVAGGVNGDWKLFIRDDVDGDLGSIASWAMSFEPSIPPLINYQGRVAVGATNFNGDGQFKFALVNGAGSASYWSNDGTSSAGSEPTAAVTLPVIKGLYSVLLGDPSIANMMAIPNSVFANPDVRLRVWFDDGENDSQLLTPDQRIAAAGYAMVAGGLAAGSTIPASAVTGSIPASQITGAIAEADYALLAGTIEAGATITNNTASPALSLFTSTDHPIALNLGTSYRNWGLGQNRPPDSPDAIDNFFIYDQKANATRFRIDTTGVIHGNGGGLTNIPASAVTGTIPTSQIAPAPPGMVLIRAGAFTMGNTVAADTDITNATPVSTTVSAFYMDVNEVTLSQWQSVQIWAVDNGYSDLPAGSGKGPNHPVHWVSWYDMLKWCNARSEQAGKTAVYRTNDAQTTIYRAGDVDVTNAQVKWTANGYRLPTEAEWEKAARGGLNDQRFPWGMKINQNMANYFGIIGSYDLGPDGYNAIGSVGGTDPATSPVGSFAANGYGLNDMAGNVFEACWDWYDHGGYAGGTDPKGPDTGMYRAYRGGMSNSYASSMRCAFRYSYHGGAAKSIGFRAVLPSGQ